MKHRPKFIYPKVAFLLPLGCFFEWVAELDIMNPLLSIDESAMGNTGADGNDSDSDRFFADANDGYPEGFV